MKGRALSAICTILACAAVAAPAPAALSVPSLVARAAAYNASALSGVVVQERHIDLHVSAGPAHFSEQNDAVVMLEDGAYKELRYLRIATNGKTLDAKQMMQRQVQDNGELSRGLAFFKQPYDARYLHDYTYAPAPCPDCVSGARAIRFHSIVRDDQHGDGTMRIEERSGKVLGVVYTPDVLPQHASSGTTTEIFGSAAPGLWTIVQIDREYSGRVAFIHGSGNMTERLDHFQRFTTAYAGINYLRHATL